MSAELVIVGDEAWTRDEWEAEQRRREREGAARRRRRATPEVKAQRAAYYREWRAKNRDHYRSYQREWKRVHRKDLRLVGSLHSLKCSGPTQATGCKCRKIRMYNKPR